MEQFQRATLVEDQRVSGKSSEQDHRGILKRITDVKGATIEDLGTDRFDGRLKLRTEDNVAAVRDGVRQVSSASISKFSIAEAQDDVADGEVAVEAEALAVEQEEERELAPEVAEALLATLHSRFEAYRSRHEGVSWDHVKASLEAAPVLLWSLKQMEDKGHSPDVYMEDDGAYYFGTCTEEAPTTSRNIVYDQAAEDLLAEGACNGNALTLATQMGVVLMTEAQYRHLQTTGKFDNSKTTWVWLNSDHIRGDQLDKEQKSAYALYGSRSGQFVIVSWGAAHHHRLNGSFRASLRVPKIES